MLEGESTSELQAHPAHRAARHEQYNQYLRNEVLPFVFNRSGQGDVTVFGASFGAYHASNLAGRYPELVRKAILFSGVYDIHRFLDGYWDDTCYFNCPTAYIANMDSSWTSRLAKINWIIATGEHDSLIQENREFSSLLSSKGIAHHAEFWPDAFGHDWPWWKTHLRRFLP